MHDERKRRSRNSAKIETRQVGRREPRRRQRWSRRRRGGEGGATNEEMHRNNRDATGRSPSRGKWSLYRAGREEGAREKEREKTRETVHVIHTQPRRDNCILRIEESCFRRLSETSSNRGTTVRETYADKTWEGRVGIPARVVEKRHYRILAE